VLVVEPLKPRRHDRDGFACGEPTLDAYLRQQAAQHHRDGISTTHVLVDDADPARILGYYSLSAAQLLLTDLQEADRKRLPSYPVPAIRMGRLAVSTSEQGKGQGDYLLAHAVARCVGPREQAWRACAAGGCAAREGLPLLSRLRLPRSSGEFAYLLKNPPQTFSRSAKTRGICCLTLKNPAVADGQISVSHSRRHSATVMPFAAREGAASRNQSWIGPRVT